jgi:protein phosphatase
MRFTAAGRTDVGLVRAQNEDNFLLDGPHGFYLVADGLGGHAAGEIASEITVRTAGNFISLTSVEDLTWPGTLPINPKASREHNRMKLALELADAAILEDCCSHPRRSNMGSTAVACLALDRAAVIGNVGDSRAYLVRDNGLRQVSVDHSWVGERVADGLLTREDARRHPYRNVITQALGGNGTLNVALLELDLQGGDRILLCSDGLHGMVSDEDILAIVLQAGSVQDAVDKLVTEALKNGGDDNVTVLLILADDDDSDDRNATGS